MKQTLINLVMAVCIVLAPIQSMLSTVLFLIATDLVTGVLAARKSKIPITSAGLQRTIVKCFLYQSAVILAFLTENYLLNHSMPVTNIVAGFVGLTELKSCLENLDVIGGGGLLRQLVEKLGSKNQD